MFRQCGHPGDGGGHRRRGAGARPRRGHPELSQHGGARRACGRRDGGAVRTHCRHHGPCRRCACRHRDRGRVRGHGREARGVRQARSHRQARRRDRFEHILSRHRRDRTQHGAAASRGRDALLQPGQRDAPLRGGAWRGDIARNPCHRNRGRAQARQGSGGRRRIPRLRRQSHAAAAIGRGRAPTARRRAAAGCRRCAHRIRFPHGPVRHVGPRGPRRGLAHA